MTRWWDRELRIHSLRQLLRASESEKRLYFRWYTRMSQKLVAAQAYGANVEVDLSDARSYRDRYRIAWTQARTRAAEHVDIADLADVQRLATYELWSGAGEERDRMRDERDDALGQLDMQALRIEGLESLVSRLEVEKRNLRDSLKADNGLANALEKNRQLVVRVRELEAEVEAGRANTITVQPDDRSGLYRLERDNEQLRRQLEIQRVLHADTVAALAKYEGVPS